MELRAIPFEQSLILNINNEPVEITVFKTTDASNIKIGINAPKSLKVNREEIHLKKLEQEKNN
jgi:carbon storage regulator